MRVSENVVFVGPPGWRRMPPVTRATLVLAAAGYVATLFSPLPAELLAAAPERILAGEVWRLVTYPLVNAGILAVLFDLLLLWSFGSQLEPEWGSRGYALFLLLATGSAGALGVLAALLLPGRFGAGYGFAGPLTAVIVAWMLEAPHGPTSFFGILPMTRRGFALLAVVVVAFGEIEQTRSAARLVFVLGGLPAAWLFSRRRRRRLSRPSVRPPRFLRRRRFRVIGNDDERFH